jgi:hypothetical protein
VATTPAILASEVDIIRTVDSIALVPNVENVYLDGCSYADVYDRLSGKATV